MKGSCWGLCLAWNPAESAHVSPYMMLGTFHMVSEVYSFCGLQRGFVVVAATRAHPTVVSR